MRVYTRLDGGPVLVLGDEYFYADDRLGREFDTIEDALDALNGWYKAMGGREILDPMLDYIEGAWIV